MKTTIPGQTDVHSNPLEPHKPVDSHGTWETTSYPIMWISPIQRKLTATYKSLTPIFTSKIIVFTTISQHHYCSYILAKKSSDSYELVIYL